SAALLPQIPASLPAHRRLLNPQYDKINERSFYGILTYRNVLWSRLVRIEYWGDKVIPLNTFRTNPIDAIKAYLPPSNSSCQAFSAAHFPSNSRDACRGQVSGKC